MIRMENSKLKLQNTELSGELNGKSDQVKMLEIECTKLSQRCEVVKSAVVCLMASLIFHFNIFKMLLQMNADLDTDRKTLMDNVSQLLSQYHELLSHSLEDKQHFHEEEKSYTERVHNLSRQKEKLEEKIMEHYKKSESTAHKKYLCFNYSHRKNLLCFLFFHLENRLQVVWFAELKKLVRI